MGGAPHHTSSRGTSAAFWIISGAVAAALLAVCIAFGIAIVIADSRGSTPVLPRGVPPAGYVVSARPPPAARPVSLAHRKRAAAERQRGAAQERRRRGRPKTVEEVGYRRADMSTPAGVEFNVAVILHEGGDLAGAIAAYRRAEGRGDPDAAFNLGVLLCEAGDLDGAETSWRRSAQDGNARATEDLGLLVRRHRERQAAGTENEGADR